MNKIDATWKIFTSYMFVLFFILLTSGAFAQDSPCDEDVCVVEFNAGWNENNSFEDLEKLTDCGVVRISIDKGDWAKKYNIVVVPTIIVFNGEEVERFQADLSFAMKATREDIQDVVDEILMEDF